MRSEATGLLLRGGSRATLSLTLAGDVTGLLDGELIQGANSTQYLGVFQGARPCRDQHGEVDAGYFVFNSEQPVVY